MLENSKDILNISLAISAFGLAFLIGWMLVYFLMIIRRVVNILQGVEQAMNKIGGFVDLAREKLDHSASYLSILATGARDLVAYLINKRSTKSTRKK